MTGVGDPERAVAAALAQRSYDVRLACGPTGAVAAGADVAVVVDVLSFSTAVTVAVGRGAEVYPFRWRDARAAAYAHEVGAVLAVGRLEAGRLDAGRREAIPAEASSRVAGRPTGDEGSGGDVPTLSPAELLTVAMPARLVLPSPNGSTTTVALAASGARVVVGCLRNVTAVVAWLLPHLDAGRSVVVVAAGERWPGDDSLRPALEDDLGAGAVLAALVTHGHAHRLSPEARVAAASWHASAPDLPGLLRECAGGRELAAKGFAADVDVAADVDASDVVPELLAGAFRAP